MVYTPVGVNVDSPRQHLHPDNTPEVHQQLLTSHNYQNSGYGSSQSSSLPPCCWRDPVAVVNPRQVKNFACEVGSLYKTDPSHTRIICEFEYQMSRHSTWPAWSPVSVSWWDTGRWRLTVINPVMILPGRWG
jgi:hypothetical protein